MLSRAFALIMLLLLMLIVAATGCKEDSEAVKPKEVVDNTQLPTDTPPTSPPIVPVVSEPSPPLEAPVEEQVEENVTVDPLIAHTWHLNNTGQMSFSAAAGTSGFDLNLDGHSESGNGVTIAVSDIGVEWTHPDLRANFSISLSKDYSQSGTSWFGDPTPVDGDSAFHGTAVSGIISAEKNNGIGGAGVAPNATFAAFRYIGTPYSDSRKVDQANGAYDIF
ncbi:MAG: S8 family serine peptidase, partial [Bdellovibrionales bacterium]|nr:S8 family serine peptidase [Bdellovibrionales bacterium]